MAGMRDPLFCKKAVPAPSAKNSYMAGGIIGASVGRCALLLPLSIGGYRGIW